MTDYNRKADKTITNFIKQEGLLGCLRLYLINKDLNVK